MSFPGPAKSARIGARTQTTSGQRIGRAGRLLVGRPSCSVLLSKKERLHGTGKQTV